MGAAIRRRPTLYARRVAGLLLGAAAVACGPPKTLPAAPEMPDPPPASSAGQGSGAAQPTEASDDSTTDDVQPCVDPEVRALKAWRAGTRRALREKLEKAKDCVKADSLHQEERFSFDVRSKKEGPVQVVATRTSLADCQVAACIQRELAAVEVSRPPGDDATMRLDFFLGPDGHVRWPKATDPRDWGKGGSTCSEGSEGSTAGTIERDVVSEVVRSKQAEFNTCYQETRARHAKIEGKVTVRFVIETDGTVKKASLEANTVSDCKFVGCLIGVFPRMKFPEPSGGAATVVFPIMFDPNRMKPKGDHP